MGQKNRYYQNITIDKNTWLSTHLNIEPGDYFGEFDFNNQKLRLTKQRNTKNRKIYEMTVTFEQLVVILTLATNVQGDKFTPGDLVAIENMKRRSPSIDKSSDSDRIHHIIPLAVCEKCKLITEAWPVFYENSPMNLLPVPLYFHKGAHPKYSKGVERILDKRWSELVECGQENDLNAIMEVIKEEIERLTDLIKKMEARGVCSINDIFN
ncbi:hypothetical protein [Planktothrix sp. FACHB-1365]|uniref:hypothetical protein n=1 Tax=Planktothrix sp. FACHB-1365 TaxID=2692855 RepID=UPI0016887399|nr:hypothetical protein [Planktothrix sp. FACHB-1365]MBD2485381.1 hypothetical protein [Planktothrix sp. FACHB-1365]